MSHVLQVQFNSEFNEDKILHSFEIQFAIIDAVASCSADIIRDKFANVRCADLIHGQDKKKGRNRKSLCLCNS